jgi:regulatory protein
MVDKEITGIKLQKRNPERVNIYLDGEYAFGLSTIVAAWLHTGQRISEEKIRILSDEDSKEAAQQSAIKLLNFRSQTQKELSQKLIEKGFSVSQIEQVLQRLTENGLVEDDRYAKMWVENRNEFHPRSQRLIRLELKQKGIEDETIESALGSSADDTELATRAAMQQIRKYDHLEWPEFRKKLSAFLMRRGFSYGTIAPVIQSVWESVRSDPTYIENEESRK